MAEKICGQFYQMTGTGTSLNECMKTEWWDVARVISPGITWVQYSKDWDEFQEEKRRRNSTNG